MSMKWTKRKPTKPGYYFYRDGGTNHDVVCVAYDLHDQLSFWEEWDRVWVPVEQTSQDAEWSNLPIPLPRESGTLYIFVYLKFQTMNFLECGTKVILKVERLIDEMDPN